jgi:hypothetical protein
MSAPLLPGRRGTRVVVTSRLLFGPNPDGQTEARTYAALETEPPPEDIGGMYGARQYPPLAPEGDHFARPRPEPDHHHQRPHEKEYRHGTGHHHRPFDLTVGHHHRPHEREPRLAPAAAPGNLPTTRYFTKENAAAVRATAKHLGISAKDLSTIIAYETIGSYSPSKQGLGGHAGLIQFGSEEQRKYGVHPGQTFAEQMPGVEQYLKDRGVKPGMGLRDVYSTVLAGSPGRYSARDRGGTVDEHVARMQRDRSAQAGEFLESGAHESQKRLLGGGHGVAPEGQISAVGGGPVSAFIAHHTGGGSTVEGTQRTLRARGYGAQYIMDREGNIHVTGGPGEHQIRHGEGKGAGLSNANTVGMEIIARDDRDVLPIQTQRFVEFIRKNYPTTPVFGHGEVNPGHKEATEGLTVTRAVRADRAARTAARAP